MAAKKLARKEFPSGKTPESFSYQGRPAKDQGDFSAEVGLADMKCVNQFGKNSNKYYHAGVLQAKDSTWWVYLEWGRSKAGRSWEGTSFSGQDYQFIQCASESEARGFFEKQCHSKNTRRLEQKDGIWVGKSGKDGYVVQKLATRDSGLPDAYTIKDASGVPEPKKAPAKKTASKPKAKPSLSYHPEEVRLVQSLVGGVQSYVRRAVKESGGVTPTMEAISEVRDTLIPKAMEHIARVSKGTPKKKGEDQDSYDMRLALACTADLHLQQLSNYVASLVPRPDPGRGADAQTRALATVLSSGNILSLQNDLDAYVSALSNEDFNVEETEVSEVDVDQRMNAKVRWIDPKSAKGQWLADTYSKMSNNRHSHLRGRLTILNLFEIERPDRDSTFRSSVQKVAAARKGNFQHFARLQPAQRSDLSDISDLAAQANVFLGIHGTRAVNVAPILQTNLRLPRTLPGAQITGAAFGHGIYWATDWRKSHGYTGHGNSYWATGGTISGRGFFMFLSDVIMGQAYMTRSTGSWSRPPDGCDSVAAFAEFSSVANDEHIIFDENYHRIRYMVEADLR